MQHKGSFIEIGHRHLSRYRAHFEKLTRAVVEHHVANRLSREDEKRFAGLAWLNELDEIKKQQEARQDRISAQRWGGVGIVIAVIGIMVAAYNAFKPPALPPAPIETSPVENQAAKSKPPPKPKRLFAAPSKAH